MTARNHHDDGQGDQRVAAQGAGCRPQGLVMGEDVGKLGGVFRVTDGLQKDFGESRVIDTPLAESGIVGPRSGWPCAATGRWWRSSSTASSSRRTTRSSPSSPRCTPARWARQDAVVVRIPYGGGIGAVEAPLRVARGAVRPVAGLRVVSPSNASDAYWMMQQAIRATTR